MLPSGPKWQCKDIEIPEETNNKICLYYRNPLKCIQFLLHNPLYTDNIKFVPYHLYKSAQKQMRLYTEWLSGDVAWKLHTYVTATVSIAVLKSAASRASIAMLTSAIPHYQQYLPSISLDL